MKWQICTILDKGASVYLPPFTVRHINEAVRNFRTSVNTKGVDASVIAHHPMDFALMHLGEYDDQSGAITPLDVPTRLVTGVEVLDK